MANMGNIATEQVQLDIQAIFDTAMVEGYEYKGQFHPDFFNKPYYAMKPSERGFIFGYEMRRIERSEGGK